jgi:hypothetical protein
MMSEIAIYRQLTPYAAKLVLAKAKELGSFTTGTTAVTVVPSPLESRTRRPPRSRIRSRIPANPIPTSQPLLRNAFKRSPGMPLPLSFEV